MIDTGLAVLRLMCRGYDTGLAVPRLSERYGLSSAEVNRKYCTSFSRSSQVTCSVPR